MTDGGIASHRLSENLERLRASAVLHSLIAKSARDLVCFVDTRGIRLFNSASYEPILGDSERLIGTRLYDDVRPDDRRSLREALQGIVRTGKTARTEYRLMARDGAARTIQSEGRAIVDAGETVSGVVLLERDVTEERAAAARLDAALRRQNALAGFSLFALRQPAPLPVIEQATITVADVLDADLATVLELEAGGKSSRIVAQFGGPASRIGLRVGIEGTHHGLALALYSKRAAGMLEAPPPVAIEDMTADPRLAGSYRVRALGMKSSLCVVVPAADGPYGVLAASWRSPHRTDADQTAFLQAVANVLSAALARFRTQAALRESEARFRSLTELSADYYWEQDEQFRFTAIIGGFRGTFATPIEQVVGRTRWEIPALNMTEADWAKHRADLEAHREFCGLVIARPKTDGGKRVVSVSGRPIFDAAGRFSGYRGVGHDVTEEKRGEEIRQRFRAAMDVSGDLLILVDPRAMRFVDANATACRLLGYTREELLELGPQDVLDESRDTIERSFQAFIANPAKNDGMRSRFIRKDGSMFPYESKRRLLHTAHGTLIVVTSRDITAQLAAENELSESERRHRELFDFSPVPIYVFDRNTLQIIAANERMVSQYGWWREELLGMSMLDLCPPAERAKAEAAARGAIDPDQRLVWRHWRRNCEVFKVEVTVHDIESYGRPVRLVSPLDVSERERNERELRESAENLRSLSRRLVSVQEDQRRSLARELHDRVGQNLTALAIDLEILRSGAGRVAPEEFERRIRESAELAEATGKLIDDVTAELHPPMLDEFGLAAALRWYGGQQAARTGLRVEVRVAEEVASPPRAERDLALFRIVQEAINNVLRHAHASRVEIVLIEDAQGLELSVRDDGRGIDAASEKHSRLRYGRRGMQERALAIGAQFEIAPATGGGTIVRVRVAP